MQYNDNLKSMIVTDGLSEQIQPFVAHGALAVFGAIVHASKAHREGTSKTFMDFIILTLMSSFSGVMFALIGFEMFGHESYLSLAMAGTGGFIGVEGMTMIVTYITARFKK